MLDIVLATLNAKFIHAAFGLRYVFANLGELQPRAVIAEFDINQRPLDIAEVLLARDPKILGLGVYIWNVTETTEVVATIKRVRPEIKIILGGPEVSYETESQEIVRLADHVITGEGDLKFAEVCRAHLLLRGTHLTVSQNHPRRSCRIFHASPCPTNFTQTPTSPIALSMWRPRAAVPSNVNSACHRWTFRCAPLPLEKFSPDDMQKSF